MHTLRDCGGVYKVTKAEHANEMRVELCQI